MVATVSYRANLGSIASGQQVTHTTEVITRLRDLFASMKDAETGQRGFLLTGEDRYLAPYTDASAAWASELTTALALLSGAPAQERRLQTLEQLCRDKMAELAQTIALRRKGDFTGALAIVRAGTGADLMSRIRVLIAEMRADESRQLATRQHDWLGAEHRSSLFIVAGDALLLALLLGAMIRTSRDYRATAIQAWIRTGKIRLSERIQGEQSLEALAERVLEFLAEYLKAQAGEVYLAEPDAVFSARRPPCRRRSRTQPDAARWGSPCASCGGESRVALAG